MPRIQLRQDLGTRPSGEIDALVRGLGTVDKGFSSSEEPLLQIDIDRIRPHPTQPRSMLPSDLAKALAEGTISPQQALSAMEERAQNDARLARTLAGLRQLAQSIRMQGLINPITVIPESEAGETRFRLETGERRWLAHWLLYLAGEEQFYRIKAVLADRSRSARARQLVENLQREDLNVIDKARAILALKQEMEKLRGSRVPWAEVEDILGISKVYRTYILASLRLCPEAQQLVRQFNLPERAIRSVVKLKDKKAQLDALRRIIEERRAGPEGRAKAAQPAPARKPGRPPWPITLGKCLAPLAKRIAAMSEEELRALAGRLAADEEYAELRRAILALVPLFEALEKAIPARGMQRSTPHNGVKNRG